MTGPCWAFYDARTGERCSMSVFWSVESCERELAFYRERDERGRRPDLHDLVPHLAYVELTDQTFATVPGDVIGPVPVPRFTYKTG